MIVRYMYMQFDDYLKWVRSDWNIQVKSKVNRLKTYDDPGYVLAIL